VSRSSNGLGTAELARFFGKAWQVRFAGLLVAATAFFVVGGTSVADSLQLSPIQRADATLGSADGRIQLPGSAPLGTEGRPLDRALVAAVTAAGGLRVEVDYAAAGLRPDHDGGSSLIYEEFARGASDASRFTLQSGVWPAHANEGLVSASLAARWPAGSTVSFFDGALQVRIVGAVLNRFSSDANQIVAGPGTWNSLHSVSPEDAARLDQAAGRMVRWSGDASPAAITAAVTRVVDADPVQKATSVGNGGVVAEARATIEEIRPAPNVPLVIAGVGGPLAAGLLAGLFAGAFTRRTRDVMWEIGISYRQTRGAALLAMGVAAGAGATAGVLLGAGAGVAIRPVISRLATQELSPWAVDVAWLASIPLVLVGTVVGMSVVRSNSRTSAAQRAAAQERSRTRAILRTSGGVVMVSLGVFIGTGTSDIAQMSLAALLIAFAIAFVAAPIILSLIGRLKPASFAARLAVRTVRSDRRQAGVVVVAIASLQILSFTLSILLTSSIAAVNSNVQSPVPPGQIVFAPNISSPQDLASVRRQLESRLNLRTPVDWSESGVGSSRDDGATVIVSRPGDLERLLGRKLDAAAVATLTRGGTLVTHRLDGDHVKFPPDTGFAGAVLPARSLTNIDPSYLQFDGFILATTAVRNRMPTDNQHWVYTNTSASQRDRVNAVTSALRLNPAWVRVFRAPDQLTAPLRISAIVIALALIAGIITLFSSLAQARAMRPQISGLQALGVSSIFVARAVATRTAISFILSTALGLFASSLAVAIILPLANLTFGVAIPVVSVVIMVGSLAVFTVLATGIATRRISRMEWQAV
jgi:hypothetical protein